ncbi:MAG: glycosyltransferase family 2 protein [Opitutus sp.]
MTPRYSLVIPVFNEEGNIEPLLQSAVGVLATLSGDTEIIVVDDGSGDATSAELAAAAGHWPSIRAIHLPENRGQAAALLTGLQAARGEIILTMDGDGQNDPRDFPLLLSPVEAGQLDLACGWRVDRHDSQLRKLMSRLGNSVRRIVLKDRLHDSGCQLRAMRREVLGALFPMDLMQSFLPAMVSAAGFRVGEFPVRHHPRTHGSAHFGLRQLWWRPAAALLKVRRHIRR